jgi:diacylglycerol kinase (ATP)
MDRNCLIIVNPDCHQGEGWKRWLKVREPVLGSLGPRTVEFVLGRDGDLCEALSHAYEKAGRQALVSAGGDGSLHYLVRRLLQDHAMQLARTEVGAIGLGSSNDFLKPNSRVIRGIPVRIGNEKLVDHDVGLATYRDERGAENWECFIVNASFGATAEGNWTFNNAGNVLGFLKKTATPLAILYAAVSTVISFRNVPCRVSFDGLDRLVNLTNLNILKIPYVSGSFHYDQDIRPDDGTLMVNLCFDMSRWEMMQALRDLSKGRFETGSKSVSSRVREFRIEAKHPMVFECDGETMLTHKVRIAIMPRAIRCLT